MKIELLSVGTELLLGDILNTNAQYLSKELAALGMNVYYQTTVGDNPARLADVVALALARNDMLIVTGGLGPTDDDLTKETICRQMGVPLVTDGESLNRIKAHFEKSARPMTANNLKQAEVPQGATVFLNDFGTAPGSALEKDGKTVIMLPGPPREMVPMFERSVRPYLSARTSQTFVSQTLRFFGIGESALETLLHDFVNRENPTVALYAKTGEVLIRVTARAAEEEEAARLCEGVIGELTAIAGEYIYGRNVENLQSVVVDLYRGKGLHLATAESCTGGMLSEAITSVSGASEMFDFGVCTYANRIKETVLGVPAEILAQRGAVSSETAAYMAAGAAKQGGAQIGVGITGIAGPTGGTKEKPVGLIYVAVSSGDMVWVKELRNARGHDRDYNRHMAVLNALDIARRAVLAYPSPCEEMRPLAEIGKGDEPAGVEE